MRVIEFDELVDKVKQLVIDANCYLPDDVMNAIKTAYEQEESPIGKEILAQIIESWVPRFTSKVVHLNRRSRRVHVVAIRKGTYVSP